MRRLALLLVLVGTASCSCGEYTSGRPAVAVRMQPLRVDFGAAWLGETVSREVVVHNDGRRETTLRLGDAGEVDFVLEPAELPLPASGDVRATVVFRPTSSGTRDTELPLVDADGKEVATLQVFGRGLDGLLEVPPILELGEVDVGGRSAVQITVVNPTPRAIPAPVLRVEGADAAAFGAMFPLGEIPASDGALLDLSFAPIRRGRASASVSLAACATCTPVAIAVAGTGLAFEVVPVPGRLDFGVVSPGGGFRTRELVLENRGERTATLLSASTGDPAFRIEAREWPIVLVPGASAMVWVTFEPTELGTRETVASFVAERGVVATASLAGHGGGAVLETDGTLDLGRVPLGWSGRRGVVVRNVGEPEAAQIVEAHLEGHSSWRLAEPMSGVEVGLRPATVWLDFSATAVGRPDGELVLYTTDPEQPVLRVSLRAEVFTEPGCLLAAGPDPLRFGLVRSGRRHERELLVESVGEAPCVLWNLGMAPGSDPDFSVQVDEPFLEIPPGEARRIEVAFRPDGSTGVLQRGTVTWRTSNAAVPPGAVQVTGLAAEVDLVAVPNPLDFRRVPLDRAPHETIRVENRGDLAATLTRHALHAGSSPRITVPLAPAYPAALPRGAGVEYEAYYAPDRVARDRAELDITVAGYSEPFIVVIVGEGHDGPCGDYCVPPVPVCPADRRVVVNQPVELPGSATDPQGDPVTCAWRLVSVPDGSTEVLTPPDACATSFVPDAVGEYILELTATDDLGNEASCRTVLRAVPPEGGLWVEMYWEQSSNDFDIHLLHPDGGSPRSMSTWMQYPWDCHWSNQTPPWDDPRRDDDPSLDRDVTSGTGVENIRIDLPSTTHPYYVGLHWYSHHSGPLTVPVVINIYCWGVPVANTTTTMVRGPNDGHARQPMVFVGTIEVSDDFSCTWTPDGTVLN
jgi:hypothetical protein